MQLHFLVARPINTFNNPKNPSGFCAAVAGQRLSGDILILVISNAKKQSQDGEKVIKFLYHARSIL
jgi:hypothetical protein